MRSRLACLVLVSLVLPGCGLGQGEEREGRAELRITRDFGRERLGSASVERIREDQTVMRLLRSEFEVETRFGGRFVQSIEGVEGEGPGGSRDWFYFVNGVEASVGAAEYELSPGDRVQWDNRFWGAAMRVPAIVGAYPEPFASGLEGRRFPVRVECADADSSACREVRRRLRAAKVAASGASLGASGTENVIRVVVAPWRRARLVTAVEALEGDPDRSGVFARFDSGGRRLELLDERGQVARRAPAGTGLIAALSPEEGQIVWAVTGVGERGVEAAAGALDEGALRDAFAIAATPEGVERLPLGEEE